MSPNRTGRVSAVTGLPPSLPAIGGRTNYRERVADALRAALVSGLLLPGEVYSAPALAGRFGVSATPVREAMLDLVKEGLVTAVPNKGFRVTEVSERQLDEYLHLRALIEIPTVTSLARTADPAAVEALRPVAAETVTTAATGDLVAYAAVDRRFHLDLLALARNAHLVEVAGDLRTRSRLHGLTALAEHGLLEASAGEHHALLDSLRAGDEKTVRRLMTRHLGQVRRRRAK
ncbi:GntR family transcriptional regulator [Streptomyces sp. NPDC051018]|uniref:GntR family transcriptional regulator n=1 Tax=Streptomyces sp. NPDC051018 TaxID=3365639 RepID=UPI0037883A56